uniref:Nucleophosmin n=1 Tax=Nannospalax galili TaxID=1026970 RepID=A0A8C6RLD2_NANGA
QQDSPGEMDMGPVSPQNYLFSCELKADKSYHFKVDIDENEHQLSLRTVSLGADAKDELHIVEAEAMNYEGSPTKVTLATLKLLKCVAGPAHISGQHLVAVEEDAESEDEEEEDVKLLSIPGKWSAPGGLSKVPQKKSKLADEVDEDDDSDDEETEGKSPVKKSIQDTPAKNAQKSNQNGKDIKPSTPRSKGQESFKKQENPPKTPKRTYSQPKVEAKFIKNCFRTTDQEAIQDLWPWRKSL